MNKLKTYIMAFVLGIYCMNVMAQNDKTFRHTIELGQTVYSMANTGRNFLISIYFAIYKLNPDSKKGIKAGGVLLIPKQASSFNEGEQTETYTFHTIEHKETLYAVSMKYKIPAQFIVAANPGLSVKTFTAGRTIRIPLSKNVESLKKEGKALTDAPKT